MLAVLQKEFQVERHTVEPDLETLIILFPVAWNHETKKI